MIEALKHAFGLCGEPHPSLLPLILSGVVLIGRKIVYWSRGKAMQKTDRE